MMSLPITAHSLGLTGELFNVLGGIILAMELFSRDASEATEEELKDLSEYARTAGSPATYGKFRVAARDFVRKVMNRGVRKQAVAGTLFLLAGFLLLACYHVLELIELSRHV